MSLARLLLSALLSLPLLGGLVRSIVRLLCPALLEHGAGGACCPPTAWPKLEADALRTVLGQDTDFGHGVHGYVSAPSVPTGRAVIVIHDIFGINGGRGKTLCDVLAAEGYLAIMPDLFGEGASLEDYGGLANIGSEECVRWLKSHAWGDLHAKLGLALGFAAQHGVQAANSSLRPPFDDNRVGMVGFCWGAWVVAKASSTGMLRAGVHVHPSWQMSSWLFGEAEAEMASKIKVATLLMPAGDDKDAYRDGTYAKIIERNAGVPVQLVDFPSMRHGFVMRGSPADPAIMENVELAMREIVSFLNQHIPPLID